MMMELDAQISTLTNSIADVDIDQPTCPFCGTEQNLPTNEVFARRKLYVHCSCEQMKDHKEKLKELERLINQRDTMTERFENQKLKAKAKLIESGIGRRFLEATFDSYSKEGDMDAYRNALNYAHSFDRNDGENLIFVGNAGTGKTHLAAAIANYTVEEFATGVEFYNYSEALAEIRAAFSDDNNEKIERKMCEADLLVIDDLGKEKSTVFSNEVLYRVINYRYREKLPTIVTTNTGMDLLYERLGEAIYSRLIHICKVVKVQDINQRMKKLYC